MSSCNHPAWLHLSGPSEAIIHDEEQLHRTLHQLSDPIKQRPSLVLFVGPRDKDLALRDLFPFNNLTKYAKRRGSTVNIRLDTTTVRSDYPLLFADSDPLRPSSDPPGALHCHEISSHLLAWKPESPTNLYDIVHARLLCPFADVVCFFGLGLWTESDIIERLRSWAAAGVPSEGPALLRPRIIIVLKGDDSSPTYNILQYEDLQFNLQHRTLEECFSSITVLRLADDQLSSVSRHRRLKELIMRNVDEMRYLRKSLRCLFSASHLDNLFQVAVRHLTVSATEPFDFVSASRSYTPVCDRLDVHIGTFLRLCTVYKVPQTTALSVVASSIAMDAYPPGMHGFDPRRLYQRLYQPACMRALIENSYTLTFAQHKSHSIQSDLATMFSKIETHGYTGKELHAENIRQNSSSLMLLRSNRTCLYCLRREPEHALACGHTLCNICIRVFGVPDTAIDFQYTLHSCFTCGPGSTVIALKPPTSGIRILTIDGGGIRGVVPLEFLSILQDWLGPTCAVQDMFDLAFGTSSGGLIILCLFNNRWPVPRCAQVFDELTKRFFRHQRKDRSIVSRVRYAIRCWLSDSCYDAGVLEEALQDLFGRRRLMFDTNPIKSSTRVAVTATTITDARAVIFSNYNGSGALDVGCGYELVRPEQATQEPRVWEAARATSAAPVLFKPFHVPSVGMLQDGGLAHNNPVNIAGWECRRLWPDNERPDVLVSLGTGTRANSSPPPLSRFHRVVVNGFVPRLWRSFMSSIDGQRVWQDVLNRLDQRTREDYHRLNVLLPAEEPAIDDVSSMESLRASVHGQPHFGQDCFEVATALLVSSFYLELVDEPIFSSGKYACAALIRSRLPGHVCINVSEKLLSLGWAFVTDTELLGHYHGEQDLCPKCRRYSKQVRITVRQPRESLTVYVQQGLMSKKRKISGFPSTISWFQSVQYLGWAFGTPYHDADSDHSCGACSKKVPEAKRYQHEFAMDNTERKRARHG